MASKKATASSPPESLIMETISAPELLQEIFSYLDLTELKRVRRVCKLWRDVSLLPILNVNVLVSLYDSQIRKASPMIASGFRIVNLQVDSACPVAISYKLPFWSHVGSELKSLKLNKIIFEGSNNLPLLMQCCPNLETLCLSRCSGLEIGIKRLVTRKQLKELKIISCDGANGCVLPLITSLAPELTKFTFTPYFHGWDHQSLETTQLTDIFQLLSATLTDVNLTWHKFPTQQSEMNPDLNAIFGVPGLKLKNVSVVFESQLNKVLDAVFAHHSAWLEELCVTDKQLYGSQLLERIPYGLPKLAKFTCSSSLHINDMANTLMRTLHGAAELTTSLREIEIRDFLRMSRKTADDRFAPIELCVNVTLASFNPIYNQVVGAFLKDKCLIHLTKLHLNNIDVSHLRMIDAIFTDCLNLEDLSLRRCNVTDVLLMHGIRARTASNNTHFPFMNLTMLDSLVLSDNDHLTELSVTRAIKFPLLRRLELDRVNCSGPRFAQLALNNPCLEVVSLFQINLTDPPLVEFVQNAPNLIKLDLWHNTMLTNNALTQIAKHRKLRQVGVTGCSKITNKHIDVINSSSSLTVLT